MKNLLILFLLFSINNLHAQKNIKDLIKAEKSFAGFAVEKGIRIAFLKYLDSNSIAFSHGKAVNGYSFWNKQKDGPGILNWHPQFAEVSISGDLGYTTGPWTYQPSSVKDSIVARGGFNSVWRLNKNGEWKNIIDIGINDMPENNLKQDTKILASAKQSKPKAISNIEKLEKAFIKAFEQNPKQAYLLFLSKQSILSRNHHLPVYEKDVQLTVINELPSEPIQFKLLGTGISTGGDLAYAYGSTELKGIKDNYLHIWRKEKEGWKIALDVLRY